MLPRKKPYSFASYLAKASCTLFRKNRHRRVPWRITRLSRAGESPAGRTRLFPHALAQPDAVTRFSVFIPRTPLRRKDEVIPVTLLSSLLETYAMNREDGLCISS
jgi:hypothetical protein